MSQNQKIGLLSKKKLSNFRLLALDMDGTTLNYNGELTLEFIDFINGNKFENLTIAFATGRMPIAVAEPLEKLNISKTVISHNGAVISDLETGQAFYKKTLPKELIAESIQLHKKNNIPIHLNFMDSVATDKMTSISKNYAEHLKITINEMNFSNIDEEVVSILFLGEKTILSEILSDIKDSCKAFSHVLIPDNQDIWFLQILPENTSKGNGVEEYAKILGVSNEQIISFGDSYNDLEMLKVSGLGIAMGNACEELKEVADYVTLDNNNNGVLKALQQLYGG